MTHATWIFPTAPYSHGSGTTAWFEPGTFSSLPLGRSTNEASNSEIGGKDEDQEGILKSVEYICELIDEEIQRGVEPDRIVVVGFSQGCVISLTVSIGSRYAGRIAGAVGLSGALPSREAIEKAKCHSVISKQSSENSGKTIRKDEMRIFLAHGTKDFIIPVRYFRSTRERLEQILGEDANGKQKLEPHEYEGMGHAMSSKEFMDMCEFLEKVIPA